MPVSDLRARLQRLGTKGAPVPVAPPAPVQPPVALEPPNAATAEALPGSEVVTRLGVYQLIENRYPLEHTHGPLPLGEVFKRDAVQAATLAAQLARNEALGDVALHQLAFLDTETTGLAGGAGTLAFLIGVGVFENNHFVLRQYFLRDPGGEEALLNDLVRDVAPAAGWVTFNGKAFDVPLLEARLTINYQRGALGQKPHLDLLMPTRRLYRGRTTSCSLGTIEQEVFKIMRDQADAPGFLIPQMYQDYLRTHDPREMHRVIYHNALDILSMVTLMAHLLEMFAQQPTKAKPATKTRPTAEAPSATTATPADWLRLGKWHADQHRPTEAEAAYREALAGKLALPDRTEALTRFAELLKKHDRRAEAAPLWEQWASFTIDDPTPFIELAKYYEWHAKDVPCALQWAERARAVVEGWAKGWQRTDALKQLDQRLKRLKQKQE